MRHMILSIQITELVGVVVLGVTLEARLDRTWIMDIVNSNTNDIDNRSATELVFLGGN